MGTRAPGRGVRGEHPSAARGEHPLQPGESIPYAARDNRFLLPNARCARRQAWTDAVSVLWVR
jgi:hypothetical protein